MPTYGYRCSKCANEFDVVERMADKPSGRCPLCGARGTRLFFPVGIVFKGTGFYKTDSRADNRGPAADKAPAATPEPSETCAGAPDTGKAAVPTSSSEAQPGEAATTKDATAQPPGSPSRAAGDGPKRRKSKTA